MQTRLLLLTDALCLGLLTCALVTLYFVFKFFVVSDVVVPRLGLGTLLGAIVRCFLHLELQLFPSLPLLLFLHLLTQVLHVLMPGGPLHGCLLLSALSSLRGEELASFLLLRHVFEPSLYLLGRTTHTLPQVNAHHGVVFAAVDGTVVVICRRLKCRSGRRHLRHHSCHQLARHTPAPICRLLLYRQWRHRWWGGPRSQRLVRHRLRPLRLARKAGCGRPT
mmetsp:Transcript_41500/g.103590  ORF Transcript_41500/g.103590 Transcript_41500/m.103590 type:complete len:221 (-) Transcript_41500:249-911(-)